MNGRVYYNEFDNAAAAWLRQLITDGHLPAGDVDERSIEDVVPGDLRGYRQHHFFAGIGGWPLALALAGWPTDRPVWTGSCPCQPFSAAGARAGFADERHLWPAWQHLIAQCRPATIFGEQVASAAVGPWLDLVQADVEGLGYAFGSIAFPAASLGAPHIRDRTYWVADAIGDGSQGRLRGRSDSERKAVDGSAGRVRTDCRMADASRSGFVARRRNHDGRQPLAAGCGEAEWMAHTDCGFSEQGGSIDRWRYPRGNAQSRPRPCGDQHSDCVYMPEGMRLREPGSSFGSGIGEHGVPNPQSQSAPASRVPGSQRASAAHGGWDAADWLRCRDGKWRPVEPGTFPLVDGVSGRVVRIGDPCAPINAARSAEARVMRLRGYGNAIVPQQSAEFIRAYLDVRSVT